ncbi:hypothetical protein [Occultella aeris]|nr:hypothetical protein [Occultella aeris]
MDHGDRSTQVKAVSVARHHIFDLKYRLGDLRHSAIREAMVVRVRPSALLVLAPHSVTHHRGGREKAAEFWTGAVAESVAEAFGGSLISAIGSREEAETAASDDAFNELARHVVAATGARWVVDIHGLAARHQVDINIGTAGCRGDNNVTRSVQSLERTFDVSVDTPFDGSSGLSRSLADSTGVRGVQLELGTRLRRDAVTSADLNALVDGLALLVADGRSADSALAMPPRGW